jgi:hypothetical protein
MFAVPVSSQNRRPVMVVPEQRLEFSRIDALEEALER